LAGFGWLKRGINVGYRHPKALLGGAAFLLLACLLPSLITLPMQFHAQQAGTPPSPATFGWIMVGSILLGLLIVPLFAGYLRLVDAAERGLPARARDIFKPYRQGEALRLMGYGLTIMVVYVTMIGIIIAATGGGIASWYMQVLTAQASHQPLPGLPHGFGIAMTLFVVLGLFMMGFYAISLGQVSLRQRGVFGAIGDGMIGALKNLLPLIVFVVSLVLAWIAVAVAIALVAGLLALLGKLVGAWLVLVLIVPLYIAMLLTMFAVMFGVMYHLWRDVCGDDIVTGMAQPIAA
jgi:MFS family permease